MPTPQPSQRIETSVDLSPEVRALVERIPLFTHSAFLHIEPLQNVISLNNTNYRMTVAGKSYLLRVASETGHSLGIRREEEIEAARAAANIRIAPEILYAEPAGHLLMPWIDGHHWEPEEFHQPENIVRLAETLRRLHSVKTVQGDGSVFRRIERLIQSAKELQQELPPHLDDHLQTMSAFETTRHAYSHFSPGLSHNDLWANNFLDDGQQLWLVDWEFAGNGDGLFDLATLSMAGNFTQQEQITLLEAYGDHSPHVYDSLQTMKWIVAFFEAMWALVLHGLRGSIDFNYQQHAERMFSRL